MCVGSYLLARWKESFQEQRNGQDYDADVEEDSICCLFPRKSIAK